MMRSYIEDSTSTEEPACLAPLAPGERSVSPEKAKLLSKIQSIPEPNEPGLIFSSNVALYSEIQCPKNAHKDETEAQKETKPAKIYKLHTIYHRQNLRLRQFPHRDLSNRSASGNLHSDKYTPIPFFYQE